MSTLEIKDLYAHVETKDGIKPILKGVNLTVNSGETHASWAERIRQIHAGLHAGGPPQVRGRFRTGAARRRRHPQDDPGRASQGRHLPSHAVSGRSAGRVDDQLPAHRKTEVDGKAPAIRTWTKELSEAMKRLKMDPKFATRSVNEGFSGGEKKRAEVLQLELLKPKFAILDETDSGLDVDALRIVSEGVNRAKEANQFGILMVTHYTRILKYIKPDIVHVFAAGHFVKTGGPELADELEESGYDAYLPEGSDSESALA